MSTDAINSATGSGTTTPSASTSSSSLNLTSSNFVQMMITQLQNQDPLNPTSSDDLMSEMSQIGQIQSTQQLQTTLSSLTSQTQIGAASSLMGKQVSGIDVNNNTVSGVVSSVQVSSTGVNLQLDSGGSLSLSNVSSISNAGSSPASGS